jgi:integrase
MSVHQTPDGRWFVAYPKGFNREDPQRIREYFGRGTEAELAAHGRNHELGLGTRLPSNQTEPTFADLADDYMSHHGVDMRITSRIDAGYKLDAHILPAIGHLPGSKVGPSVLDRYVLERSTAGRKKTTIHRELSIIRAILLRAVERRKIAANPMHGYRMPRRDDAVLNPPTAAELAAIHRAAAPHLQRALMLAYYTAMRPGGSELLALRWEHIDLMTGTIFVESAKKGGMRSRVVPIAAGLALHLTGWLADDRERGPLGWVVHYGGDQVGSLKTSWRAAKARAGITRRMRMYDLRHMAASEMLASGADLKSVSEILGHASPDMTLRTYQHTITAQRRAAVEMLGQCLPLVNVITETISDD